MKLMDLIVKEFISIVENLTDDEPVENGRIVIEKELFRKMLEKYHFMKFRDKCNIYKSLNFVIHDKNNYTLPVKDTSNNKTVRKVVLNFETYELIKKLYETELT